jgi:hypothetical protein
LVGFAAAKLAGTPRTWIQITESAAEIGATIILALGHHPDKLQEISDLLVAHLRGELEDKRPSSRWSD